MKISINKGISIGVVIATIAFSLIFVFATTFYNPLVCESCKNIILISYTIYFAIVLGYWIFFIINKLVHGFEKWGIILLLGAVLFFIIPALSGQGLLLEIGMSILVLNMIVWSIYYIIQKDARVLILISGIIVIILTLPYCGILWD